MFKDFAIYVAGTDGATVDPQISYVRAGSELASGPVGSPWTRPHISFVPDRDGKYLSVAARVQSPATAAVGQENLNSQYFTKWQLERSLSTFLPRDYNPAREIQVVVKADRVNLVPNPSFEVNTTGWSPNANCTIARSTAQAYTGTASLEMTATALGNMQAYHVNNRFPVTPGSTYTAQMRYRPNTTPRNVRVFIGWYTSAGAFISSSVGPLASEVSGEWVLATGTAVAPSNAASGVVFSYVDAAAAGEVHYIDAVMVEAGSEVGTYFDGTFGDDYIWENGGTAHNARSYYYENRLDRGEAIRRALIDGVPWGIGVGVAQFGVFTG
jgi:hypothetical protein